MIQRPLKKLIVKAKTKNFVGPAQIFTNGFSKGFTIIETLIAITVLMIAIAGPLTIASKGLTVAASAREQTVGLYLAQSAMEFMKNIRDTNLLSDEIWLDRINPGQDNFLNTGGLCNKPNWCTIDTSKDPFLSVGAVACNSTDCDRLYTNPTKYYYTHDGVSFGNSRSIFSRKYQIEMKSTAGGGPPFDEALITVFVQWDTPKGKESVVLKSDLLNVLR